ncbi:hypothetical protein E8E15_007419 [Penicillium rubens]|uniref:Uncharacterized protein n=1 Tax=Penicillium rubens (strain ATCC 28089 / DSM 1075 / NRRL 1951 / Wisconsin 54-1255) TaxID=500485 RepID=B6HDB3_PENRW|nr:hypothetical protein E8E15_007419 [Penicillium rubens]CAP86017.1 hypothetical protein PCH_Pc20g06880 [Penicillium rubens Wisconsin 54-1255]
MTYCITRPERKGRWSGRDHSSDAETICNPQIKKVTVHRDVTFWEPRAPKTYDGASDFIGETAEIHFSRANQTKTTPGPESLPTIQTPLTKSTILPLRESTTFRTTPTITTQARNDQKGPLTTNLYPETYIGGEST